MKTLYEGKIQKGAPEGKYLVRLVPSDDDDEGGGRKKRKASPVAQKYLDFKTSGLTIEVPPAGDVSLAVTAR